jgi:hypothetical protein
MFCVVTVTDVYSRKFGPRLRGKFGNLLKTAHYPDSTDRGTIVADWVICGTVIRSRFYLNESSFRLAAETSRLAARSGKPAKGFGVTAAAVVAERSPFLGDEPAFARLLRRSSRAGGAAGYLLAALAAATIWSKRLSPRKESQHGLKRRSP